MKTASATTVRALIEALGLPDAIDPARWEIEEIGGEITASNSYHIIDKHGHFDQLVPIRIVWGTGGELIEFSLDGGHPALSSYLETVIVDRALDQYFHDL